MCTDPKTGEVRRSTAGPSGTFTCDEKGEKILIIIRDKTKCEVLATILSYSCFFFLDYVFQAEPN